MAFTGITVDTVVGDANTGVQSMFPRFTFDETSRPSMAQLGTYARSAISKVTRLVKFKGYEPADITDPDDLEFVAMWINLTVAAEVHTVLDQFKDSKTANARLTQLESLNKQYEETEDPFPGVRRAGSSEAQESFPTHVVRVSRDQL